jgi:protein-tyrosine phosphatase
MLLDPRDEAANAIFEFIEEALNQTESVLVHSVRGQSRATCALAAYIMRKYKWSLLKSLEFLNSRRPDLEIRATFIHQLSAYEARLVNSLKNQISQKWDELSNKEPTYACEELLLRNTFINS